MIQWVVMHLSILCPTTPHPGYVGEKVTGFDTKTCLICGEFDCPPYACATIKSIDSQIPPIFSSIFEWVEGWDLTDWHAQ